MNEYNITQAFKRIETILIESMIRNLSKHRASEEYEGKRWEMWQSLQLGELEKYRKRNAHRFDDDFKEINDSLDELFREANHKAFQLNEYVEADTLMGIESDSLSSRYFGVNEEQLNSLIDATVSDFEKAERAVLRKANDEYRKIIFDAQVYAETGGTYEQAIDMATKDFLRRGITSIVYKNGARHTISDYASMAIRTGQKRAYLIGLGNQMKRVGIHTIRVNKRNGACPLCAVWLGKVLIDDVYGGGTEEEAKKKGIPTLSEAMDKGFLHPNCKDIYSMYVEGISKEEEIKKEDIEGMTEVYNLEQKINRARDTADSYQRMVNNMLDDSMKEKYRILERKWREKQREFEAELRKLKGEPEPTKDDLITNHSGFREAIDIKSEEVWKGIYELPDGVFELDDSREKMESSAFKGFWKIPVNINKRISVPYEELSKRAKRWADYYRGDNMRGKPFYIQKSDIDWLRRKDDESDATVKWATENGYSYVGNTWMSKYNVGWDCFFFEKDGKYSVVIEEVSKDFNISKETMDKILEREKEVSSILWDKGVRFKDLTARQGDDWVKAMEEFHTAVEADLPVSLVSGDIYDTIEGEELYRGIAKQSHIRGDISMVKTPEECAVQLMEGGVGDCYPSRGIYGDGVAYLSNSVRVGRNYAGAFHGSSHDGAVVRMKLKEDARIIEYDEAVKLFERISDQHPSGDYPYFSKRQVNSRKEVGKAMQMLGYDAILQRRGDGMDVHFYVILNRNALVSVKDDYRFE